MFLDLHTHSTASDGQYTPAELVSKAKESGIELLALTDHDTVSGICEARTASANYNLPFVAGVEFSTRKGVEIHVLGLGINETHPALQSVCSDYHATRLARAEKICSFLKSKGIELSLEEVITEANGASITRPHFANLLVRHGLVKSKKEAFRRYLDTYSFHQYTDVHLPTPEEAISVIHESGGIAVLAHPGLLKLGRKGQEDVILNLTEHGLDGLEVYHSAHEYAEKKYYKKLAAEHHLIITAGSDFHGEKVKPSVKLGMSLACVDPIISK